MKFDEEFKDRMLMCRSKIGITQSELAAAIGVAQRMIAAYELGQSRPRMNVLLKLADAFEVSPEWLSQGSNAEVVNAKTEKQTSKTTRIPILSESQIISRFFPDNRVSRLDNFIHTDIPVSSKAFAYTINDDSMLSSEGGEYSFPIGTKVVFDPVISAKNGDFVLVLLYGQNPQVFFRRFTGGMEVVHFNPLNSAYPKDEVSVVNLRERSIEVIPAISVVVNLPASKRVDVSRIAMQVATKAEYESPKEIAEREEKKQI
ncbi:TPA: helix-turn-helix domain-containing protein [Citrobacter koseri]|nr:helix-turn-helix domain-containing protein [Citrobacter koseri]